MKRFGNWRAKLRGGVLRVAGQMLYRRGGGSEHMLAHLRNEAVSPDTPSGRSCDPGRRRNFGTADKRRIVEEAVQPGATESGVAKKYGIGPRPLFQWKIDLMPDPQLEPVLAEVKPSEPTADEAEFSATALPTAAPVVVAGSAPGIEVALTGGRGVRFDREANPETIRSLVAPLEGADR